MVTIGNGDTTLLIPDKDKQLEEETKLRKETEKEIERLKAQLKDK